MDLIYLALVLAFFGLSWGLVRFCSSLGGTLMTWLDLLGGGIAVMLLAYLVIALLRPEKFS